MKFILLILLLSFNLTNVEAQDSILLFGNTHQLCLKDNEQYRIVQTDSFPQNLNNYKVIMLFSTANSKLNNKNIDQLVAFLQAGNSIYLGCENWPLQAETNQMTRLLFQKEFWGNTSTEWAVVNKNEHSIFKEKDKIQAGTSTVQFPMDMRLKVEAWVDDEPLILSSESFGGRLVLDGGYSRFYCSVFPETNSIWDELMNYLLTK